MAKKNKEKTEEIDDATDQDERENVRRTGFGPLSLEEVSRESTQKFSKQCRC